MRVALLPVVVALALVLGAVVVAAWLTRQVLRQPESRDAAAIRVSDAIREGALAFLHRQYRTIAVFVVFMAALLAGLYWSFTQEAELAVRTALAFVLGAACSAGAGYFGVHVAIRTNRRVAHAAATKLNQALKVAIRGGAVNAVAVVGLSVAGIAVLYLLSGGLGAEQAVRRAPFLLVGYALGASSVALFAQLGGGIYTKAADLGADLVGKLETGIPEDDPRNPAVIADLVGDNVGDCAGRGADLFESTAAETIGTMIVAVALYAQFGERGILFPLVIGGIGIVASLAGLVVVRTREDRDPMIALNRGYYLTAILVSLGFVGATRWLLHSTTAPDAWLIFAACGWIGVATSLGLSFVTQYYTLPRYKPLRLVVRQSKTGAATNVLAGFSVGLACTLASALVIAVAVIGAHQLGAASGLPRGGLFGTAIATSGILAMATYVLAMDTFGPIVDNAGGIVQMSNADAETRRRTDLLDSCGNTTKALTKSYALGSAALAAFLLLSAYLDETRLARNPEAVAAHSNVVDLAKPEVFVAGLLGAMLVFYFSARAIRAVASAAEAVILDVRAQLRDRPGIMDGDELPDYARSVDIATKAALREMVYPALIAVGAPIAVGLTFRALDIGAEAVAGMLLVTTIVGVLFANVLNTSGAVWDNAKKAIEKGAEGGKKSAAHRAAVIGDTVGDPFKDTAGPSLHVLVKLVASVALVLAPLFV